MRIGLVELLLILLIASLTIGPSAALWVARWMRRAQKTSAAAARRRAAQEAQRAAEREEVLQRFQKLSIVFVLCAAVALIWGLVLRPIEAAPTPYTAPDVRQETGAQTAAEGGVLELAPYTEISALRENNGWLYAAAKSGKNGCLLRMQPDGFDALMQLLEDAGCRIKRGAHISIKLPEGKRYIRLDTLGSEYDETSLRRTLAHDHVHIPKIPRGDFTESQVKRLIDIEAKLRASKGKGFQVWAERNNIDAKAQMIIFLKEHQIDSLEELNDQIQGLTDHQNELKASIREKQNRMKEIIRQRQAIRDYSRTKEVYTQYRESGWTVKFYQEHRQEIENHRNAQAVYSSHDGKMPTLKELTAEYDGLKEQKENDQAALDKLKPKLTDLKHIRYNYEILERDSAPNSHQHVIPKDHHYDEHGADHDDESR